MTEGQRSVKQKIIAEPGAQVQNVVQAVIEQVTLGVRALPTDYATRIANFLCDYLGTPERPVPFDGREEALQALDRWLDDPTAPPYLLLAAPAGRGKSALLVRWLERLRQRAPDLPVVFVPVSLRYETASQAVFFAALAPRLAELGYPQEALAAARELPETVRSGSPRAEAPAALAPHLPPNLLAQALAAAREIGNESARAEALAALAPRLAELPRPALYPLWDETLPLLARRTRPDLLADLRALVPVIHALGGEAAIAETARAIQDTARWWP